MRSQATQLQNKDHHAFSTRNVKVQASPANKRFVKHGHVHLLPRENRHARLRAVKNITNRLLQNRVHVTNHCQGCQDNYAPGLAISEMFGNKPQNQISLEIFRLNWVLLPTRWSQNQDVHEVGSWFISDKTKQPRHSPERLTRQF